MNWRLTHNVFLYFFTHSGHSLWLLSYPYTRVSQRTLPPSPIIQWLVLFTCGNFIPMDSIRKGNFVAIGMLWIPKREAFYDHSLVPLQNWNFTLGVLLSLWGSSSTLQNHKLNRVSFSASMAMPYLESTYQLELSRAHTPCTCAASYLRCICSMHSWVTFTYQ